MKKKMWTYLLAGILVLTNLNTLTVVAEDEVPQEQGEQTEYSEFEEEPVLEEIEEAPVPEETAAPEEPVSAEEETAVPEENGEEVTEAEETTVPEENAEEEQPAEEEEESAYAEQTAELEGITVYASYEKDAFETEAVLTASVIEDSEEEYKDIEESLGVLAEEDDSFTCDEFVVFDISFLDAEGNKLEPAKDIDMHITMEEDVLETVDYAGVELVHIDSEGTAEIVDASINEEITDIEFTSDVFSPFAVVRMKAPGIVDPKAEGWNDDRTMYAELVEGEGETAVYAWVKSTFKDIDDGGTQYTFYFDSEGKIVKNQEDYKISSKYYKFDESGHLMKKAWSNDGTKYYTTDGSRASGQLKVSGYWYYFNESNGVKVTGLKTISAQNKTVFYDSQGRMHYGEKKIDGYWYYFKPKTGAMVKSNFADVEGKNKTCYYDAKGHMVYGEKKINGYEYLFNKNSGAMYKGLKKLSNGNTICYGSDGRKVYGGEAKVNGNWYYFEPDKGYMLKKAWVWLESGKKSVFYRSDGTMAKGTITIDGITHTFDKKTGKGQPQVSWCKKHVKWRPFYLRVNVGCNVVTVYTRDYKGEFTIPVKAFICSTGKKSRPTLQGKGYTSRWVNKWYFFPEFETYVQYPTFFRIPNDNGKDGQYFFHSLIYESQNKYDLRTSSFYNMGKNASSGCIRMYVRDTKWIYDNIVDGTSVHVYKDTKYPGPLGKPAKISSLSGGARMDPTDIW